MLLTDLLLIKLRNFLVVQRPICLGQSIDPTCDAQVRYREERMSFLHFLTNVCAIVGGVFTVSGIVDAFVYHGAQAVRKKVDLGKQI